MFDESRARTVFYDHRRRAKLRGIGFYFTFIEWVEWWEDNLGYHWLEKRGARRGQYVMARFEDKGPYTSENTKCILSQDNHIEYNKRRKPSRGWSHPALDEGIVIAIYLSPLSYDEIAGMYRVTKHKIQCIKRKHYYRSITDRIDEMQPQSVPSQRELAVRLSGRFR